MPRKKICQAVSAPVFVWDSLSGTELFDSTSFTPELFSIYVIILIRKGRFMTLR